MLNFNLAFAHDQFLPYLFRNRREALNVRIPVRYVHSEIARRIKKKRPLGLLRVRR